MSNVKVMNEYNSEHSYACAYYNDRGFAGILLHLKWVVLKIFSIDFAYTNIFDFLEC